MVTRGLLNVPGVTGVHDLHIWNMSTTEVALTAHLVVPVEKNNDALLSWASQELHDRYDIQHVTLQIERGDPEYPCASAEPGVL
jgi:cobalt-zinc-cadmium efflux system protein